TVLATASSTLAAALDRRRACERGRSRWPRVSPSQGSLANRSSVCGRAALWNHPLSRGISAPATSRPHGREHAEVVAREDAAVRRVHHYARLLDPAAAERIGEPDQHVVDAPVGLVDIGGERVAIVPGEAGRAVAGNAPGVLEVRAPSAERLEAAEEPNLRRVGLG